MPKGYPGSFKRGVMAAYAAIEMACVDACARATERRFCELVGGPVRDSVEFAAYLFFRYAADHPEILSDPRLVDSRGRGDRVLGSWGEFRTPEAMAAMAAIFRKKWGFRVFKLKTGVLDPDLELQVMNELAARLGPKALLRIDPNGVWREDTAVRIGKKLAEFELEILRRSSQLPESDGRGAEANGAEDEHEHVRNPIRTHSRGA